MSVATLPVSLVKSTGHPVVTHFVGGWDPDPVSMGIPQRVFGYLADLAAPVVNHYRSDLFHDAIWLRDHVTELADNEALTFHYVIRDSGTHLSQDERWTVAASQMNREAQVYSLALVCTDRGKWELFVSRSA